MVETSELERSLAIILFGLVGLTLPYSIWCLVLLARDSQKVYLVKRYPALVACELIVIMFMLFVNVPTNNLYAYMASTPEGDFYDDLRVQEFIFAGYPLFVFGMYVFIVRVWFLYWDMMRCKLQNNQKWKLIINPALAHTKLVSEQKNPLRRLSITSGRGGGRPALQPQKSWFLDSSNKKYFKNTRLALAIVVILVLIEWAIYAVFRSSNNDVLFQIAGFMVSLLSLLRIGVGVYIWRQMRKLQVIDKLGIRKEIAMAATVLLAYIFLQFVVTVLENVFDWFRGVGVVLFVFYSVFFTSIFVLYDAAHYPRLRNDYISNYSEQDANKTHLTLSDLAAGASSGGPNAAMQQDNRRNVRHWSKIVNSEIGFEGFMTHLSMEFSSENLLFILEYTQLKETLLNTEALGLSSLMQQLRTEHSKDFEFELNLSNYNDEDAVSMIVSNLSKMISYYASASNNSDSSSSPAAGKKGDDNEKTSPITTLKTFACVGKEIIKSLQLLYDKYIDATHANYMINLSYQRRHPLLRLLDSNHYLRTRANRAPRTSLSLGHDAPASQPHVKQLHSKESDGVQPIALTGNIIIVSSDGTQSSKNSQNTQNTQTAPKTPDTNDVDDKPPRMDNALEGVDILNKSEKSEINDKSQGSLKMKVDRLGSSSPSAAEEPRGSFHLVVPDSEAHVQKRNSSQLLSFISGVLRIEDNVNVKAVDASQITTIPLNPEKRSSMGARGARGNDTSPTEAGGSDLEAKAKEAGSAGASDEEEVKKEATVGKKYKNFDENAMSLQEVPRETVLVQRAQINEDFEKKLKSVFESQKLEEKAELGEKDMEELKGVMKWLLLKLLKPMDGAATEISGLMQDSFFRFQTANQYSLHKMKSQSVANMAELEKIRTMSDSGFGSDGA